MNQENKKQQRQRLNKCTLCDEPSVTAAAQILVCERHNREYEKEGRLYLPLAQRPFYQRLIAAYEKRYQRSYFC